MSNPPAAEATITKAAHAAVGLAVTLAARLLPWSNRSQHDAYLQGYREGLRDGVSRG